MSGRNFRRMCVRYDEDGVEGLRDRRLGKPAPRRAPAAELTRMQRLFQERYRDLNTKHFHEHLVERHHYKLGHTVTRLALQAAGLVAKSKRGGTHRKKRERRPLPGMLLFQDGSTHRWVPGLDHDIDLVVTPDDATGAIYSAIFVEEEGTMSSFMGLAETIAAKGLFSAFYTDRGSHYFYTPKAGGKVDKTKPTQVGRALAQLGITHIPSYSPVLRQAQDEGARTHGADVRHLAGPAAARVPSGEDHHGCRGQSLPQGALRARLQCALRRACGRARLRLCTLCRPAARGRALHPGGPPGRARQLRPMERDLLADPIPASAPPLRQGNRPCAPIPRWQARHLRRAALPRPLRQPGNTDQCSAGRLNPLGACRLWSW